MGKSLLEKVIFQVAEGTLFFRLYFEMLIQIVSSDDLIEKYTKLYSNIVYIFFIYCYILTRANMIE